MKDGSLQSILYSKNCLICFLLEHVVCQDEFKYALLANNCLYPGLSTLVTLLLHSNTGEYVILVLMSILKTMSLNRKVHLIKPVLIYLGWFKVGYISKFWMMLSKYIYKFVLNRIGMLGQESWQQVYGRHSRNAVYHIQLCKSVFFRDYKDKSFTHASAGVHKRSNYYWYLWYCLSELHIRM